MHGADFQRIGFAQLAHTVNKGRKWRRNLVDFHNHDHRKIFLQNRLGNIHDIDIELGADATDFGDDAYGIATGNTDYSLHKKNILSGKKSHITKYNTSTGHWQGYLGVNTVIFLQNTQDVLDNITLLSYSINDFRIYQRKTAMSLKVFDILIPLSGVIIFLLLYAEKLPVKKNGSDNKVFYKRYKKFFLLMAIILLLFCVLLAAG